MKKLLLSFGFCLIVFAGAFAQSGDCCPCNVDAYLVDDDPAGLNIRSGPSPSNEIISRIPFNDYGAFTAVHIVDAKNGWLKISGWNDAYTNADLPDYGWIYGEMAETSVRGYADGGAHAYAGSNIKGGVIGKFMSESGGKITDCDGGWVLIKGKDVSGHSLTGWLEPEEQCPNAVTTCP